MLGQDRDRVPRPDRMAGGGQRHIDAFGHQDGRIALGTQHGKAVVEAGLGVGARDVDPLARLGALRLRQRTERLARERDRRSVAEVLGLGFRKLVEVRRVVEGTLGCADRFGQRYV
jgi:hypothetical protein